MEPKEAIFLLLRFIRKKIYFKYRFKIFFHNNVGHYNSQPYPCKIQDSMVHNSITDIILSFYSRLYKNQSSAKHVQVENSVFFSTDSRSKEAMEVDKDWKIFSDDTALSNIGFYGIVILNRRINIPPAKMSQLWSDACWRMTIDGGTDRWLDYVNENSLSLPLPNYVTGDFDSIRPETLQYCRKQEGITVMNTPDQDLTDFEKGLNIMVTTCTKKLDYFVVVCENSGRLDQIFSNLNTLYKSSLEGFMISKSAVSWLLRPGEHRIHIPCSLCNQDEICGILPLSKPAKVTTRGLKWNLNDSIIEFGGLISSSNTYEGTSTVQVTTDSTVVWTMTYND